MKNITYTLIVSSSLLFSCGQTPKEKAFKVFNEGVSFSLDAANAQQNGNMDNAVQFNKKAIEKFEETLNIDSNHKTARSALAHSLYLDRQYDKAIYWFEQSNKKDGPFAPNYLELGLSKIDNGLIKQGTEAIQKAFELDTSKTTREITVDDLLDLGNRAFDFGKQYTLKGDTVSGQNYKHFAIAVLITAFNIDKERKDISQRIASLADSIPDKKIADKYRNN